MPGPFVFRSGVDGPTLADMAYRFTSADRGRSSAADGRWSRLRRRLVHSDRQVRRSGHERGLPQHEASGGAGPCRTPAAAPPARARPTRRPWTSRATGRSGAPGSCGTGPSWRRWGQAGRRGRGDGRPGPAPVPAPVPPALRELPVPGPVPGLERGGDVGAVLEAGYRDRGPERVEPGRLGAATWGTGRGAAPPRFDTIADSPGDHPGGPPDTS
jgi:hypothetical protein